ncbi:MAG TPA: PKD domain-containing protein [Bacteroidales bacterium]|nr:PKD domain-containing protein [Bacteroidales bacterium]
MNIRLRFIFLFVLAFVCLQAYSQQDYYWVGGTGNWDDLTHWSDVSGGAYPSSVFTTLPGQSDNVFFNAASFNSPTDTVTLYSTVEFHDMYWEDYSDTVTFFGPGGLFIHGSLQFCARMRVKYQGDTRFLSNNTETITTNGNWIPASCFFFGNGTWNLLDDFIVTYSINLDKGSLITNSWDVTCSRFTSTSTYQRYLDLGDSFVTITAGNTGNTGENYAWDVRNTSTITLVTGNHSQIHFYGAASNTFGSTMHAGSHLKYDLVHFHISPGKLLIADNIVVDADSSNYDVTFDGVGFIIGDSSDIYNSLFHGTGYIDGNVNNFHNSMFRSDGYINGNHSTYNLVTMQGNGWIGNLSLVGRNVNDNTFNIVDIYHQGRVYGDYNSFNQLLFSTHPHGCGCGCCGHLETGELHANFNTVHQKMEFNRDGYVYGGQNYFDSTYFWYNGWILEGSNTFYDLNIRRIHACGCTCLSYYANTLTIQSNKTQHILDDLTYWGDYHCMRSYLRSSDTTVQAFLLSDSVLTLDYMAIRDIIAQNPPALPDSALRSEDLGGNQNWFFDPYIALHPDTIIIDSVSPCYNSVNGSVQFIISGGVGPYQYSTYWPYLWCEPQWYANNTFNGFGTGSHAFYIKDSYGCRFDSSFVTPGPPIITLYQNTVITHVSCFGANNGTITIYAQGGTGPLQYSLNNVIYQHSNFFDSLAPSPVNGYYVVYVKDSVGCVRSFGNYVITQPPPLILNVGGGDVSIECHGDSTALLVANATGGTPPYTYVFMGPINLGWPYPNDTIITTEDSILVHAGTYRVKVIDANGCEKVSGLIQRNEPTAIDIEFATGAADCFSNTGFWATANVSGGSPAFTPPPYTFLWSNGATTQTISNLVPGDYTVTVTDGYFCTMVDTVSIKQLDDTIIAQDVFCYGGNTGVATVVAAGGTNTVANPYTYLWSTGSTAPTIFNLTTGWYFVTVTDGDGCELADSVFIDQPDTSVYLQFTSDSTLCNGMGGGWAVVHPYGGTPPYQIQWSTGETTDHILNLNAGTYFVTVTDSNHCIKSGQVTIYEPLPGIVTFATGNIDCDTAGYWIKAYVQGGTAPFTYTWSPVTSALDSVYGLMAGTYSVSVTDHNGCNYYGTVVIAPLATDVDVHDVDCYGGNTGWAVSYPSGGTAPYTWQWKALPAENIIGLTQTVTGLDTGVYVVIVTDSSLCWISDTITVGQPAGALQLSVTHTDLNCYGTCNGTAGVIPNFGTSPYGIPVWSNGSNTFSGWSLNNLCAGAYTVSVTDANNCLAVNSVSLLQPPQLLITAVQKEDPLCNEAGFFGSITITAQGGSGVLEYSIHGLSGPFQASNQFTGLGAGSYTAIVRDANLPTCYSATQNVSITPPPVLTLNLSGQGPTINGGSNGFINSTATGGTSPYGYLWNTGATAPNLSGLPAGTYTLTLTDDHGCFVIKSMTLYQPDQMVLNLVSANISCNGAADGTATATVSGGVPPYQFAWNPGPTVTNSSGVHNRTNLSPGTYALTVTDNSGVLRTGSVIITQPPPYQLVFNHTPNICDLSSNGYATVTVSGNTPPYTYQWNAAAGSTTDSVYNLTAGTYTVTVRDSRNCSTQGSVSITYWSLPVASFGIDTACLGNPNGFSNFSYGTPYQIDTSFWSFGDGNLSFTAFPDMNTGHIYANPGTYTTQLYVKDTNGCLSAPVSRNVLVYPIPDAAFETESACFGQPAHFYDGSTNTMGLITERIWIFGNYDTVFNQLYPSYIFPAWGEDSVKLIIRNTIGCSDSVSHAVQTDSLPYPSFSYQNLYCTEGQVQFTNTSLPNGAPLASWFWEFGNDYSSSAQHPLFEFGSTDTTYLVSLTATSARGCSDTVTLPVYVSPPFQADFTADTACWGSPTWFTDSVLTPSGDNIISWIWDFGDGSSSFDPDPSHTYLYPGIYTVFLLATDQHQCEQLIMHKVVVDSIPEAAFEYSLPCDQDSVFFTDLSIPHGSGIITWAWSFGDPGNPLSYSLEQNPGYQYPGPGQYTVSLTVTDEKGCQHTHSRVISVLALPEAAFITDAACQGEAVHFTDLSQSSIIAWNWDFGVENTSLDVSSLQHPEFVYASAGTYTVRLIVENNNGCKDTTWKQVTIQPKPTANFLNINICQNEAIQFNDLSTSPVTLITDWAWNFGEPLSGFNNVSFDQNPVHQYYQAGFYSVRLIVADDNGCRDTMIKNITIYPHPLANFNPLDVCHGLSTQFTDLSVPVYGNLVSWQWDFADMTSSSLQHPLHLYPIPGSFQVSLVVANNQGCSDTVSKTVQVFPRPDAAFSFNYPCVEGQTQFQDNSNPNALFLTSWVWNFGDPASGFGNFSANQHPTHLYGGPGNYPVRLVVTNSNQCSDTVINTLTVAAPPGVDFGYTKVCRGMPTEFSDSTSAPAGGLSQWQWNFGDGSAGVYQQNPSHTYANAGTYYVSLLVTDVNGCQRSKTKEIIVYPLPNPSFQVSPLCTGQPAYFTNYSNGAGAPVTNYSWNFGDLFTLDDTSHLEHPEYTYTLPGTYDVLLSITNSRGCVNQTSQTIVIEESPVAGFLFDTNQCTNEAVHFTDISYSPANNIQSWHWNFGDGQTSSAQNPIHYFTASGTYYVQLTVETQGGCVSKLTSEVVVYPPPVASFEHFPACEGRVVQFNGFASGMNLPVTNWLWNFADGTWDNTQNPQHVFQIAGTYYVSLTVTDSKGCTDTYIYPVVVHQNPVANFVHTQNYCQGTPVCFSDVSNTFTLPVLFRKWNFGDPLSGASNFSNDSTPCHAFMAPGWVDVSLIIVDQNLCSDTVSLPVLNKPEPLAGFSYDTVCLGDTTHFVNLSDGNGAGITYFQWNFGDPVSMGQNISFSAEPVHQFTAAGIFEVSLIIIDSLSCRDTLKQNVFVRSLPLPSFTHTNLCLNDTIQFTSQSTSANGPVTSLLWTFPDGSQASLPVTTYVFPGSGTFPVQLEVTDAAGCSSALLQQIHVHNLPSVNFTATQVCEGTATSFTDNSTPGIGGIIQRTWIFGDGDTLNTLATQVNHLYSEAGSYMVRLIIGNSDLCTGKDSALVLVHAAPLPAFTFNDTICFGDVTHFDGTASGGNGSPISWFEWNFGDGGPFNINNNSLTPDFSFSHPGDFNVTLAVGNANNCSRSLVKNLHVYPLPAASFIYDTACFGNPTLLSSTSTSAEGNITSWLWTMAGQQWDTLPSLDLIFAAPGLHPASLLVTNQFGCTHAVNHIVPVDSLPVPAFSWSDTCVPGLSAGLVQFTDLSSGNGSSLSNWEWRFNNQYGSSQSDPLHFFYPYDDCYPVSLTVINARGCRDSIHDTVCVKHPLNFDFFADTVCFGAPTQMNSFVLSPEGTTVSSWTWDFGDGSPLQATTADSVLYTFQHPGIYTVTLIAHYLQGCGDTIQHSVLVRALPQPGFSYNLPCQQNQVSFTDQSTSTATLADWYWTIDGGFFDLVPDPVHTFTDPGVYEVALQVTDIFGCHDQTVKNVEVHALPQVSFHSDTVCFGLATAFTSTSSAGTGNITQRLWKFGDDISMISPFTTTYHQYANPGTYNAWLILQNTPGCVDSASRLVTVRPKPEAAFTVNDPVCFNQAAAFNSGNSLPNGGNISQWYWKFNDPGLALQFDTSYQANPQHTYTQPGSFNVQLIIGNTDACFDTLVQAVVIHPLPQPAFSFDTACFGNPTHFSSLSVSPSSSISNWMWNFNNTGNQNGTDTISYLFPHWGHFPVQLTVTDENSCVNDLIYQVFVDSLPIPAFSWSDTCVPGLSAGLVQFTDLSSGNGSSLSNWEWRFNNQYGSSQSDPLHFFYPYDDCYPVSLTVINARGCRDSIHDTVCVKHPLNFDFFADTVCFGAPTQMNSFVLSPEGTTVSSWTWDFGDGSPLQATTADSVLYTFQHPGIYTVTLIAHYLQGCGDTIQHSVLVRALPQPGFSYNLPCQQNQVSFTDQSTSTATLADWYWTIDGGFFDLVPDPVHTFTDPGVYEVALQVTDIFGCHDQTVKNVEVHALPQVSFHCDTVCFGLATAFTSTSSAGTGNITQRLWKFGDDSSMISPFTIAYHQYADPGTYTAWLILQNTPGCMDSASRLVTVKPKPEAAFTVNDPVCFNQAAAFNSGNSLPNGGNISQWYWKFNDPGLALQFDTSYQTNPQHTYTQPGSFNVQLIIGNTDACFDTLVQAVVIHPLPQPAFSFDTACFGNPTHFSSLSVSPSSSISNWMWNFNNTGNQNGTDTISYLFPHWGHFPVQLTVTDANSCVNTIERTVLVDSLPIPAFTYTDTCFSGNQPGMIYFHNLSQGHGSTITQYHWHFNQFYYSDSVHPYHVFIPAGQSYPVSLTVTNDRGCSDSLTQIISVKPEFNIGFSYTDTCLYSPVLFNASASPPGTLVNQWSWDFGDNNQGTVTTTATQHLYQAPGSYIVTLTAANADNCVDSAVRYLDIYPPPLAQFAASFACCNDSTVFTDLSLPVNGSIVSWTWYFGDPGSGAADTLHVSVPGTPVWHFYPQTDSVYLVTLIVTNSLGCSDTVTQIVYRCPCLQAAFDPLNPLCDSVPAAFANLSTAGGNSVISSLSWDFGDGSPLLVLAPAPDTVYHLYSQPGQYIVMLIATAQLFGNILQDTAWDTITVHPNPRAAFLSECVCFGEATTFQNTSFISGGSMSFTWELGNGSPPLNATEPPPTVYQQYQLYQASLLAVSDKGCRDSASMTVCLYPLPEVHFTADPLFDCGLPGLVTFTDLSTIDSGYLANYTYDFGDGWTEDFASGNVTHTYNQQGHYSILLTVTSNHGCSDSLFREDYYTLYRAPQAAFSFNPPQASALDGFVRFTDQTYSLIPYQWFWNMGDGTQLSTQNPLYQYSDTGTYVVTLHVIDDNNCEDSVSELIIIYPESAFYIPNAFTPDGNGRNDHFGPQGVYVDPDDFLMVIFNRWGEEIFSTSNFFEPWDGKKDGEFCPIGVYNYFIRLKDVNGERHERKGTVLLLKKD